MSKLLLYCTKAKPYLRIDNKGVFWTYTNKQLDFPNTILNGKIVAECDFEVENLRIVDDDPLGGYWYETKTLSENEVLEKSCLTSDEVYEYLGDDNEGYAIHIKNLHIFDKPRELSEYYKLDSTITLREVINRTKPVFIPINKAPQSMMHCFEDDGNHLQQNILISIKPQWLCKILNKEKTIEVRKKVLKEMLK